MITSDGNVVVITTIARPANVQGTVWSDTNLSGIYDNDDVGIADVVVFLDTNGNEKRDLSEISVLTDSAGLYSISELPHGPYLIMVDETTVPAEFQFITNNNPFFIVLEPVQDFTGLNYGYRSRFALDPGTGKLLYPTRLTWTESGRYFVTDSKVDAMFIYDSDGNLIGQLRGLDKPLGIVSDEQGNIYVGNNGRDNVEVYSAGGVLQRVVDNGNLKMPNDLVLDRQQNLYVLDSQNKMVKVYNPKGQFLRRIGRAGGGDGHFAFPIAIAT